MIVELDAHKNNYQQQKLGKDQQVVDLAVFSALACFSLYIFILDFNATIYYLVLQL